MKIIVTGTTGIGKSTTVDILEREIKKKNIPVLRLGELVIESDFFDYYFESIENWGFLSQVSFLLDRFKQWIEIENKINSNVENVVNIFDRHFLDDLIFSELYWIRQNISNFDSIAYKQIYNQLLLKLKEAEKIDYLFLLKSDYETILNRLIKRGRENELEINKKYWKDLYVKYYEDEKYQNHFKKYSKKMFLIDTTNLSPEQVAKEILNKIDFDQK